MNEFGYNVHENLILCRNKLIACDSNYFGRLHSISISQYIPPTTNKNSSNNVDLES